MQAKRARIMQQQRNAEDTHNEVEEKGSGLHGTTMIHVDDAAGWSITGLREPGDITTISHDQDQPCPTAWNLNIADVQVGYFVVLEVLYSRPEAKGISVAQVMIFVGSHETRASIGHQTPPSRKFY